MTSPWLVLTAALIAVSWFAIWARRPSVWRGMSVAVVPVAALAGWLALHALLGLPSHNLPQGEFAVLGARIDTPTDTSAGAIYVLVDGSPPRYYVLPYSKHAAEQLQAALNDGNGIRMEAQEGGDVEFGEAPVAADEPKQAETPIIGG